MSRLFPPLPAAFVCAAIAPVPALLAAPALASAAAPTSSPTWAAPTTIGAALPEQQAGRMSVAADANGNAVALWIAPVTTESGTAGIPDLMRASRPAGGSWSDPSIVQSGVLQGVDPELSVAADGSAGIAWVGRDQLSQARFISRSALGAWSQPGTFGPTTYPTSGYAITPQYPKIRAGRDGALLTGYISDMRWIAKEPVTFRGTAVRPAGAGSFTELTDNSSGFIPVFDPAGQVAWLKVARTANAEPTAIELWTGTTSLTKTDTPVTFPAGTGPVSARIAYTTSGTAVLVWSVYDAWNTKTSATYAIRKPAGGTWSAPVKIADDEATDLVTAGDDAFVEFMHRSPDDYYDLDVSVARGTASGDWQAPESVDAFVADGSNGRDPVALSGNGAGDVVLSMRGANGPRVAVRPADGAWSRLDLPADAAGAESLGMTVDASGVADAVWTKDGALRSATAALRTAPTPTPTPSPTPTPTPSPTPTPTPTPTPSPTPTPTPTPHRVDVKVPIYTLFRASCPSKYTVWVNGQRAGTIDRYQDRDATCRAAGSVTVSSTLRRGSLAAVVVTAPWALPAITLAPVRVGY